MSSPIGNLFSDLQRRQVFKATAIYVAAAWVLVQVIDVIGPYVFGDATESIMRWLVAIVVAGFPITVLLAWLFDITPDGVRRTKPASATGMFAIATSIGLLVAGTAGFVWLMPAPVEREQIAEIGVIADSVAIMPFMDLSPDKSDAHLTDGIASVLIHKLSPVAQLTVFAIDSTIRFRGEDPRTVRQQLGATRLLSGSVQRSGQRFRISTWLVDTRTGKTIWSEQFDRGNQDIFEIQDEIALAVAKELGTSFDATVRDRIVAPLTDDLDAYDLFLKAIQVIRNTPLDDGNAEGIALLEAALEMDPEFALGWAVLASTVYWHTNRGYMPREEGLRLAEEYQAKALALDPELSEAYAHATVKAGLMGDLESARSAFEKAVEYGPSNARAYMSFGIALRRTRQFPEALEVLSRGMELDPYNPDPWMLYNLGRAHLGLHDYTTGMHYLGTSYQRNRGTPLAGQSLMWQAEAALEFGRYDEAIAALEIARRDGYDSLRSHAYLARALLILGEVDWASEVLIGAESLRAQQRAAGQTMNPVFWQVEEARLYLDLITRNTQNQLETARHYTALADDPEEVAWDYRFEAALLNIMLGRSEDTARLIGQLISDGAHDPENYAMAVYAYQQAGDDKMADRFRNAGREVANEFASVQHPHTYDLLMVALFRAADGANDAAVKILQRAYDEMGYRDHLDLTYMPVFDALPGEPEYMKLIRKMRADTERMRERVIATKKSGDWEALLDPYLETEVRISN